MPGCQPVVQAVLRFLQGRNVNKRLQNHVTNVARQKCSQQVEIPQHSSNILAEKLMLSLRHSTNCVCSLKLLQYIRTSAICYPQVAEGVLFGRHRKRRHRLVAKVTSYFPCGGYIAVMLLSCSCTAEMQCYVCYFSGTLLQQGMFHKTLLCTSYSLHRVPFPIN